MNHRKILYYERIGISEGTDINKTSASKEGDICHHWYFSNNVFNFDQYVCNDVYKP